MSAMWDERADAYRASAVHASGPDLDLVVELCGPRTGLKIVDVATGGGHVARRLREAGAEVVTVDLSPGMQPDVLAPAEELPFEDGSFDVVVNRLAAHHFDSIPRAVAEFARVTRRTVVIEDHRYTDEETEEAERLRDPSHGRSLSELEWRGLLEEAGLKVTRVEGYEMTLVLDEWLARTGCAGEAADRARELLAPLTSADGSSWDSPMVILQAVKP